VIHHAVDLASFRETVCADAPPRIISVGRFAAPKDFETLIEALSVITADYQATLVGEGPAWPEIAAAVSRRGLASSVELLGLRLDVPDLLARSDIFALCSRSEGHPVSILEAMAAGLPVVATDVGGVAEAVVEGETGFRVPPGDPAAVATALQRLIENDQLRRRLGEAGRRRARERFDAPRFRAAHLELYRRELERLHLAPQASEPAGPSDRGLGPEALSVSEERGG